MLKRPLFTLAALSLALLGFGGCKEKPPQPSRPPQPAPEGNVISLSLSGGHMTRDSFYSYYLREKDSQVLFDANCWVDGREITLESATATQENMEELRALCETYNLARRQQTYRKPDPNARPFLRDAPMRRLSVRWENDAQLSAGIDFGNLDDLLVFFEELAIEISKGAR